MLLKFTASIDQLKHLTLIDDAVVLQNWVASSLPSLSSMSLSYVSVKGKLGNLVLFLIVAATCVQNSVAAAATATTSLASLSRFLNA